MTKKVYSIHAFHNKGYEPDSREVQAKENCKSDAPNNDENRSQEFAERDVWSRPVEFLLSCIAMSVGLGNIWRFPFAAYENGGGAFLIPYVIILIFLGKPLYYMEMCMGQFSSSGCTKVWAVQPFFRGIGFGQVISTWCVLTFYMSILALTIRYMVASVTSVLPWTVCPTDVPNCVDIHTNLSETTNATISAAETYFQNDVIKLHPNGLDDGIFAPDLNLTLCLLAAWVILFLVSVRGVKSSGKAAYFTAIFPYLALITLLGKGASLPGAIDGIKYFITPQWDRLLDPKVWFAAVGQSFFSLNVGFGSIATFSSFNKFSRNVYRDTLIISAVDTLTSLLAGLTIFSVLGHQAHLMGVTDINQVIKGGGAALAFISYPEVLGRFEVAPQVFSFIFFFMLLTLGIGSASGMTSCIVTAICDQFSSLKRLTVTICVALLAFLCSLIYITPQGPYFIDLIDFYGAVFIVYVIAFLETIAINWFYGFNNFKRDIRFMINRDTGYYWALCWVVLIPLVLVSIMAYRIVLWAPLTSGGYEFGPLATGFGFTLFGISLAMIPICFLFSLIKRDPQLTIWEAVLNNFRASEDWYPKDLIIRKRYREYLKLSSKDGIGNVTVTEEKY